MIDLNYLVEHGYRSIIGWVFFMPIFEDIRRLPIRRYEILDRE